MSKIAKIVKRKFTATGGNEDPLNESIITSKYMPSYKWALIITDEQGKEISSYSFRTKRDAHERLAKIIFNN